jgi:signal transduction histidine kinase
VNTFEVLAGLPYFSGLPVEQIEALCMSCEVIEVERGQVVIVEGSPPEGLLVVVEGSFEATRQQGAERIRLGDAGKGEVLGEMSILENRLASATVRALEKGSLIKVPVEVFRKVLADPGLLGAMVSTVTQRLREREAALFQNEKLASLGVLSAGLLHEVNNPAAAIARAAHHLAIVAEELVSPQEPVTLSPLQRSQREQAMTDLLESAGLESALDLAASLVSQGWTPELVSSTATEPAELGRLARLVHARQLALEVGMAAAKISQLVNAVKRWTYSGQGPVQDVDLNQVIIDSCTLLRHKTSGKKLELNLAETLPSIPARGVELSQVVTNLIDNALDAAVTQVIVKTSTVAHEVLLEVSDDGSGIPADQISRIWEPFFTTKPLGVGTGIGLPISRKIIVDHGGRIEVESKPGNTVFVVHLPTDLAVPDPVPTGSDRTDGPASHQ